MMESIDWLEATKIALTAGAFILAFVQYVKAQSWKRMEFTAAEIAKFRADPTVKKVIVLLDWPLRPIQLDSAQGLLDPPKQPSGEPVSNDSLLPQALMVHTERLTFTRCEAAIRDHFDVFLDFLCHFETFIQSGLLTQQELHHYLEYWMDALAGKRGLDRSMLTQFWRFVDFYGYAKARNLVQRYHPTLATEFTVFVSRV
jgi:hypothetical protein